MLTLLAVGGVLLVAIGFRFYDIQNYPPGLFPDEAANGEDALLILEGDVRPFYPRGNGREGLFFFLQALSIKLFGIGVWQLHIVSAAVGVATVLLTYFATRVWFGRLAGVLATLLLATSHWHVTLSRTGFRAILAPLFIAAFTACVGYTIQAVRRKQKEASLVYAALAGAALAGGFYTYIAYRAMVGVILGMMVLLLLAALHPKIGFLHLTRYWRQVAVAVVVAVIVFLPLGLFFLQDQGAFAGRASHVSIFSRELQQEFGGGTLLGTLAYSTRQTLLSFFYGEGDLNWRHNVAGYPLLNPLVGLLFLLGVAWTLRGAGLVLLKVIRGQELHLDMIYPYTLLLLVGMLLPVITTAEGIPHGLRSLGLAFPIFFLAGTAGAVVVHWVAKRIETSQTRSVVHGLLAGTLMLAVLYDGSLYFLIARNDAGAHYAYRADLREVASYLKQYAEANPSNPRPYLVLDSFSLQTPHFLTHSLTSGGIVPPAHDYLQEGEEHPDEARHAYRSLEPALSYLTKLEPGEVIIFTQSTMPDADRFAETYLSLERLESRHNRFGQEIMRVYRAREAGDVEGIQNEAELFDLDA